MTKSKSKKCAKCSGGVGKIVLAYSGGLDTSVIIPWLLETYPGCEVIAFAANVGQDDIDKKALARKAIASGASKCYVEDLREEFVQEYVWPTLKANARYEGTYLLGTSMARPLIAKRQVEIALQEGADAVAHGATGKGNDQVRFELTYMAMAPHLKIIAPWKDPRWTFNSREDLIDYAEAKKIPLGGISRTKIYSEDGNLWHLSHEGGILEYPGTEHKYDMLKMSNNFEQAPDKAAYAEIAFEKGVPVALNGKRVSGAKMIAELNALAGKHAVGLLDIVEDRLVGLKSRGVYETPAGTVLYRAHELLETLVLDKQTLMLKQRLSQDYANIVYNGEWFTPAREALDAFVDQTQKIVTGTVRVKLYKGNIIPAGIESPYSIYDADLGGFTNVDTYDQKDATGFIRCYGLPLKTRQLVLGKKNPVKF